ncbi:MAG: hypothetical protein JNK49_04820 [Planctomycetes bacterium]|nr:hypothetical protein [Planctomycetota bacterium]
MIRSLCSRALLSLLAAACSAPAPAPAPTAAPTPAAAPTPTAAAQPADTGTAPAVVVPSFPNNTCPIMGKAASLELFTDTPAGRIYLCCKPCVPKVQADVPAAVQTAFPVPQRHRNPKCPVTGNPIGAFAETVVLQGHEFQVCCAECVERARRDAQTTLVHLLLPEVRDLDNPTCPVSGEPVAPNAVVQVGDELVHLASLRHLAAVERDPAGALAKARTSAAGRPASTPHVPQPRTGAAEAGR